MKETAMFLSNMQKIGQVYDEDMISDYGQRRKIPIKILDLIGEITSS